MLKRMVQLKERLLGKTDRQVTPENPWFAAHFDYAATIVGEWLKEAVDLPQATVVDLGCGDGITDLGVALKYKPQSLLGIDVTRAFDLLGEAARTNLGLNALPDNLHFRQISPGDRLSGMVIADAVFSWSAFEHIDLDILSNVADDVFQCLKPGGILFVQVEPLYFSPFGSHLGRYCDQPWAHLLLSESDLWEAVQNCGGLLTDDEQDLSSEKASNLAEHKAYIFNEYKKLNKITADQLVQIIKAAGFDVLKDVRKKVNMSVPKELTGKFPEDVLLTNEIILLAKKPKDTLKGTSKNLCPEPADKITLSCN